MARQQPPQAPPPVQRLRIRFAKRGRLRFISHRDFARAFERAIQRSGAPIAYSSGFSPHPRISYAGAVPTGAASEAEYLEIGLARRCDPEDILEAIGAAMPPGLDLLEVVESSGGSLADRLEVGRWRITLSGVDPTDAAQTVDHFLGCEEVIVERMTKKGRRTFDCRSSVIRLEALSLEALPDDSAAGTTPPREPCAILDLVVRQGTPAVRPDDVLAGLRLVGGLVPPDPPLLRRIAQGPLANEAGTVGDPLEIDRDVPKQVLTAEIREGATAAHRPEGDVAPHQP